MRACRSPRRRLTSKSTILRAFLLGRALLLTANGGREYRRAAAHLDRRLREHPASRHAADARILRAAPGAHVAQAAELDRRLERLRAIDLELERPRRP